ncbi:ParA family protein [Thalassoglobus sp.]|uniref:ParA family protein n=1 Tax=Thalassoglobus sp. TaxID=2795869 RepID=UPI003AA9D33D
MKIVSIYNNKGGEGKSTVSVGLTEFLAANRKKKVLLIDLDGQASSSCALLGHLSVKNAIREQRTSVELMQQILHQRKEIEDVEPFLTWRPATDSKRAPLAEIAVMVPDGSKAFELEEQMKWNRDHSLFLKYLKPALKGFDYVLIDMPGNLQKTQVIAMNGMVMSDHVVVPVKPTHISLNALPNTFEMIEYVQTLTGDGSPSNIGILRNFSDKRRQQYQTNFPGIESAAANGELPPLFENSWTPASIFETATDDRQEFRTLYSRFGSGTSSTYKACRLVAKELDERCSGDFKAGKSKRIRKNLWERLGLA